MNDGISCGTPLKVACEEFDHAIGQRIWILRILEKWVRFFCGWRNSFVPV